MENWLRDNYSDIESFIKGLIESQIGLLKIGSKQKKRQMVDNDEKLYKQDYGYAKVDSQALASFMDTTCDTFSNEVLLWHLVSSCFKQQSI